MWISINHFLYFQFIFKMFYYMLNFNKDLVSMVSDPSFLFLITIPGSVNTHNIICLCFYDVLM